MVQHVRDLHGAGITFFAWSTAGGENARAAAAEVGLKACFRASACEHPLEFPPWDGDSPSDEICPTCKIQFGYDDAGPGPRHVVYEDWRCRWIANGRRPFLKEFAEEHE